jgi:hypothetical protein
MLNHRAMSAARLAKLQDPVYRTYVAAGGKQLLGIKYPLLCWLDRRRLLSGWKRHARMARYVTPN